MANEQKLVKFKQGSESGSRSANLGERDVASLKERNPSNSTSSVCSSTGATSGMKSESDHEAFSEPAVHDRPVYRYCYPGNDAIKFGLANNGYYRARGGSQVPLSGPVASSKQSAFNSIRMSSTVDARVSKLPMDLRPCMSTAASNSTPSFQSAHLKPSSNKVPQLGSNFQSARLVEGCYPVRNVSSPSNQVQGPFTNNGPLSYRTNGRAWDGSDRFNHGGNFNRNGSFEAAKELNRGPRALRGCTSMNSLADNDQFGHRVRRERYNLPDFRIVHDNAKFFVIKSYSEDDIHKSIKYDVWASTPNGNRKLDAAFQDVDAKFSGTGTSCPIFLFFSVNTSGQFVGLAEMVGRVDFKKDMDFWQQDKWSGFFPVKWHIIKDIPNNALRHIILENNDHKPVTYTRDTQEVGLKQGLEMLSIFKSYREETSMLDDFSFYEDREKSLHARRSSKVASPEAQYYRSEIPQNNLEPGLGNFDQGGMRTRNMSDSRTASLVALTKNLSLSSPPKSNGERILGKD